jgi:hypothetical protein
MLQAVSQGRKISSQRMMEKKNPTLLVVVVFIPLSDSQASEFCVPMFQNTLFRLHRWCRHTTYEKDGTDGVFRNVGT